MAQTVEQAKAAVNAVLAISEAIRELKTVPSGELYAHVCDKMELRTYEAIIQTLKNARLVEERAHMLTWIGPEVTR